MSSKNVWIAFGIGVATGAAVALLYAPQSGDRTRKRLGRVYEEAGDYLDDATDYLKDQAERVAKQSKNAYAKGADSVADVLDAATDTYSGVSDKLADAFSTAQAKAGEAASYTAAYGKKVRSMV